MDVVQVILPCATGDEVRYQARIMTPLLVVTRMGVTRMQAITNCLKEFNDRTHYDKTYLQ